MKRLLIVFLLCLNVTVFAANTPLPADQAFQVSAKARDYQTLLVNFSIARNHYLYKKAFHFQVIKPENVRLGMPLYPSNTQVIQTIEGPMTVYSGEVVIPLPIINATQNQVILQVQYQGCSKAGYCYPPITKNLSVGITDNYLSTSASPAPIDKTAATPEVLPNPFHVFFQSHSSFMVMIGFLGFGILLSLTPCVLPMIPILSSLIVGQKNKTKLHAFFVSLAYVIGMSIAYAALGILFGFVGSNIQLLFQQSWVILVFSVLFVLMALSLFGFFQLQLPEKLRRTISALSQHQKRGSYIGAAIMGALSLLILSPCVTPPLVAALGFISQTGDIALGGFALFFMGIGMGVPLLVIGAIGPSILPKSGAWMNVIKNLMGVLLLGVAIYTAQRILPHAITVFLWAALCVGIALYCGILKSAKTRLGMIKRTVGILFFVLGILIIANGFYSVVNVSSLHFTSVQTVSNINSAVKAAKNKNASSLVMLDFYADWCIACKEFDVTLKDPAIQQQLSSAVLLRADITRDSAASQKLMRQFNVIAPPTILFFRNGKEISDARIVGYQTPHQFLKQLYSMHVNAATIR